MKKFIHTHKSKKKLQKIVKSSSKKEKLTWLGIVDLIGDMFLVVRE